MSDNIRETTIADYLPDRRNHNRGTVRGDKALEHSLRSYGLGRSIVVDKDRETIGGAKTLQKAAELGFERVLEVDSDGKTLVVVRRTDLDLDTDVAARELSYADNITAAVSFDIDPAILQEDLETGIDLSGLCYDGELNTLLGAEPVDVNELWKGMPEFEQEDQESWKSIKVHFANQQDYEAFARLVNQTLTERTKYIWYPAQEIVGMTDYRAEDES